MIIIVCKINTKLINALSIKHLNLWQGLNDSLLVILKVTNWIARILSLKDDLFQWRYWSEKRDLLKIANIIVIEIEELQVWCTLSIFDEVLEIWQWGNSVVTQVEFLKFLNHILDSCNSCYFIATQIEVFDSCQNL